MMEDRRDRKGVVGIGGVAVMLCATFGVASGQTPPTGPVNLTTAPAPLPPDAPKPPYKRLIGPETLNPGDYPAHFPYPDEYDSAVAAAEVHHIRYVDSHIRLVEVAYFPGVHGQMHGHPFPSVFAVDSPAPNAYNIQLDPERKPLIGRDPARDAKQFPFCRTMNPQAPHAETNQDTWPHHFYRLEFLRVDGNDLKDHWTEWYPLLAHPLFAANSLAATKDGSKFSAEWPYPLGYDSVRAAPKNNRLLYEDDHIRLVEVSLLPGESEPMEGVPYPSVFAMDTLPVTTVEDKPLDPKLGAETASTGHSPAPAGFEWPVCSTAGPEAPHALKNTGDVPVHYYRIDFKRIDGEGLKTHWREWYPWMAKLTDEYAAHPYVSNYH
jgi:hypothetical protein